VDGAAGADPVEEDAPAAAVAAAGLVTRERAGADGERAAVLDVNGPARAAADDAAARRRAAPGPVAGEGILVEGGGALSLDRAAVPDAAGTAAAIAAQGLVAGEGRVVHGQRTPGLIEDAASHRRHAGAPDRPIVDEDAVGHGQPAAGVVDPRALGR